MLEYEPVDKERTIKTRLEGQEVELSEKLGQHFLVEQEAIDRLSSSVITGAKVIEVGSGIGHVTESLSERAASVVGIEIDTRFQSILEDLQARNSKVRFVMKDAVKVSFNNLIERDEEAQVIANLPFHITEPFMYKLIDLPITNAVVMVGDNVAREFQESENSLGFGKMSLLSQTFFNTRVLGHFSRESFYPQPRTDATLLEFIPRDKRELEADSANYVFAYLFRNAEDCSLVRNDMKQALVQASQRADNGTLSKKETHRRNRARVNRQLKQLTKGYNASGDMSVFEDMYRKNGNIIISQSQALRVIEDMGIPERVLSRPFFSLDNQDIRNLTKSVRNYYHSRPQ